MKSLFGFGKGKGKGKDKSEPQHKHKGWMSMLRSKPKAQESSSYLYPITDRRSAEVPNRFSASEADNLSDTGMLPRSMSFSGDRTSSGSNYRSPPHQQLRRNFSSRHQVPAVRSDLYDEPRKNTKRRAFEDDYFEGVKVERLNLCKASAWELKQVDNTEFDKGWKSTLKIIQEFEARTAHIPSYDEDTPEVCSDSPCSICLRTGHSTCACPYKVSVPYGATVSKGYEIVCKACGHSGDHQHTYDGIPRSVVMKFCVLCQTTQDHWPDKCRMGKKSRKQGEFGSTSEQGHEHWQQDAYSYVPHAQGHELWQQGAYSYVPHAQGHEHWQQGAYSYVPHAPGYHL